MGEEISQSACQNVRYRFLRERLQRSASRFGGDVQAEVPRLLLGWFMVYAEIAVSEPMTNDLLYKLLLRRDGYGEQAILFHPVCYSEILPGVEGD